MRETKLARQEIDIRDAESLLEAATALVDQEKRGVTANQRALEAAQDALREERRALIKLRAESAVLDMGLGSEPRGLLIAPGKESRQRRRQRLPPGPFPASHDNEDDHDDVEDSPGSSAGGHTRRALRKQLRATVRDVNWHL